MSLSHKTFQEFADHLDANLGRYIATRRDHPTEDALKQAFALYSYVMEDCTAKATKNTEILAKTGIMLIEVQDVLRGIVHGMAAVSPAMLAMMLRVVIEVRCNYRFIMTRDDPAMYADRYRRYGRVITLIHDSEHGHLLSPEVREEIVKASGEWVSTKSDGTLHYSRNWTGDPHFNSLKKIAKEVGLEKDYQTAYSAMSQAAHGTALVTNLYRDHDGIHPVGVTAECKRLAMLGAFNCMFLIAEAAEFFGIPFDHNEYATWSTRMRAACADLETRAP